MVKSKGEAEACGEVFEQLTYLNGFKKKTVLTFLLSCHGSGQVNLSQFFSVRMAKSQFFLDQNGK